MSGPGRSEGDIVGLMAVGLQFGMGGIQAADTVLQLTTGPLQRPGMLLALAFQGERGLAILGDMLELAFLDRGGSMGGAALGLGGDALDLEAAAVRFMGVEGFFTDPIETVPLSALEADGEVTVERTVSFTLNESVSFRNAMVAAGSTLVVEYLSNGMVRVTVRGNVRGGVDGRRLGLEGVELSGGPLAGATWLLPNAHEASQLVAALGPFGYVRAAADGAAGDLTPIPVPQGVTVGYTPVSISGNLSQGGSTLVNGSVEATGEVTVDEQGQTVQIGVTAEASSALAGPVLNALPPHIQRQLPGEGVWPGGNFVEAGGGASLSVRTDHSFEPQEISLTFEGSFGQGAGLSTSYAGAQSTAGASGAVTLTLDRADLEAMGPEGQRVLDALRNHRPDQAVQALQALGGEIVDRAEMSVESSDYVSVNGDLAINAGGTGLTVGGGARIETARP